MVSIVPPLDMDLASVDTSFPIIADGNYDLRVEKTDIKETANGKGVMLVLELATTAPTKSRKGDDMAPGVRVFDRVNLVPTGKATWEQIQRGLASLVQAAGLSGKKHSEVQQWHPELKGQIVRANVGYEPPGTKDGKSFKEKNVVNFYVKK